MHCFCMLALTYLAVFTVHGQVCRLRIKEVVTRDVLKTRQCTILRLENRNIHTIESDALKGLTKLKTLYLDTNNISMISSDMLKDLKALKLMSINANRICNLKDGTFKCLSSLETLSLEGNCLVVISNKTLTGLVALKVLNLEKNSISYIANYAFQDLDLLQELNLQQNVLKKLQEDTFFGLISLVSLELKRNRLEVLKERTFGHLTYLEILCLENNKLTNISEDAFFGLKFLKTLNLERNRISHLSSETFTTLLSLQKIYIKGNLITKLNSSLFIEATSLQKLYASNNLIERWTFPNLTRIVHLDFSRNRLNYINGQMFKNMKSLESLYLRINLIQSIEAKAFYDLKRLKKLYLDRNQLTQINKSLFKELTCLESLHLYENNIEVIEAGSFRNLMHLKRLYLYDNKLTIINKDFILGLLNLDILDISYNEIHSIEEGSFAKTLFLNKKVKIDISHNNFTSLSWDIYLNSTLDLQPRFRFKSKVTLLSEEMPFACDRTLCWLQQLEWKGIHKVIYDSYQNDYVYDYLGHKCKSLMEEICPNEKKWCMYDNATRCKQQCVENNYASGNLMIHKYYCPFQYFCECTCSDNCARQCALQGKTNVYQTVDMFGCNICSCKCKEPNCWKTCNGSEFELINNTFGCPECKCGCPAKDCDRECSKTQVGIVKYNKENCIICDGCITKKTEGSRNDFKNSILPFAISLLVFCLFITMVIFLWKRCKTMEKENDSDENNLLNILTHNLDPELAQQVKKYWFVPNTLCCQHLLGKAEFKDVWSMSTKCNYKSEQKSYFENRRVELALGNETIREFLNEALIMKKFNHPNVLNLLGISAHEEKPCVILPLMVNGDLKNYLRAKKSNLAVQHLVAFCLGVAKGMQHMAEQRFVHCDLAARNCMLDGNLVVKVSDFGLTKDVCEEDYYKEEDKSKPLPMRWMSPEAIEHKKFTLQNDLWSYGVLLWEIFSYGELPYQGIENTDILKFLMTGQRLEKPIISPDYMYEIMLECWKENPKERPTFKDILSTLDRFADIEADYFEVREEVTLN